MNKNISLLSEYQLLVGLFQEDDNETVDCSVKLNTINISSASGPSKKEAKDAASAAALIKLERQCYTIMVKNRYTSGDGTTVNATTLERTGVSYIPYYQFGNDTYICI